MSFFRISGDLASVVLLLAALCPLGDAQPASPSPPQPPAPSNCSYRYTLSPSSNDGEGACRASCLLSSPPTLGASPVENCPTVGSILQQHAPLITEGDCLELLFAPGLYLLASTMQVGVRFSLVMRAPEGGVTFTCGGSECASGGVVQDPTGGGTAGGGATGVRSGINGEDMQPAMMAFGGVEPGRMSVRMDGIHFRDCSRHLQFDEVDLVSVHNCTFV